MSRATFNNEFSSLFCLVSGWLYDKTSSYDPSFYVSGGWVIVSGLMLLPTPIMLRRANKDSYKDTVVSTA